MFCRTSTNFANYISKTLNLLLLNKLNQTFEINVLSWFVTTVFNKLGNDLGIIEKDNEYELIVCIVRRQCLFHTVDRLTITLL